MISNWLQRMRKRRHAWNITKNKKRIKMRFGQGEERYQAIEFFNALGGQQGAAGLLERFMVKVDHSIRDEEEKQDVFNRLASFGKQDVVPAIEEYLNRRDASKVPVTWPMKVLDRLAQPEEVVTVLIRALEKLGIEYTKEPERKVVLLSQLAEYSDPRVAPALIPFLRDHRDEVKLEALSAITRKADESAREAMLDLLVDPETPMRLRASIAESLMTLGWLVKGYRKKVEEVLPEGLHIDRSGRIKGRGTSPSPDDAEEEED